LGEDWNGETGGPNSDLGTPIHVVSNGVVTTAKLYSAAWGNVVIVKHQLSDGSSVESMYAHLQNINVTNGQAVTRGQIIGTMGKTGSAASTVHLHFEIRTTPINRAGYGYASSLVGWTDPSNFIDAHRPGAVVLNFWKRAGPIYASNHSGVKNFDAQFQVKNTEVAPKNGTAG